MIFVDSNVFMYAVGSEHRLKGESREFFDNATAFDIPLVTSVEVVQELLHAYLPVQRINAFSDALSLVAELEIEVWPLEMADVMLAWKLREQHPSLSARDLCHLASCRRRSVQEVMTFDRALRSAFDSTL